VYNNLSANGLFGLVLEGNLGYSGNGHYGYDTVSLGYLGGAGTSLEHQVVAGIDTKDFWLGSFGLSPAATNFTDFNHYATSYMANLKNSGVIPSISYGYTAGNQYRLNGVLGSLTLGGYDAAKFEPNGLTWNFDAETNRELIVNVASITIFTGGSNITLITNNFPAFIDSTVPYFFLPADVCRKFEQVFGITYDNRSQLYLVSDSLRTQLKTQASTVTISLANLTSKDTVNITFPYDAFDLTATHPLLDNATSYFPLKEANNSGQVTLGRAFLQEA
jgi:hypothetical protein